MVSCEAALVRALPVLAFLTTTGCVENYGAFYISRALVPAAGCVAPAPSSGTSGATEFVGKGLLDVSLKRGYVVFLQVENHMTSTSGSDQVETNLVQMREFRVQIDLGQVPGAYPEHLLDFVERTSGVLEPGGLLVSGFQVLKDELAGLLSGVIGANKVDIVADLQAVGMRSGSDIETPRFPFPIQLCNGCLVDMRQTCPTNPDDATILRNACGLPQDAPVTCCPQGKGVFCFQSGSASGS
jgi:hypothetical protein